MIKREEFTKCGKCRLQVSGQTGESDYERGGDVGVTRDVLDGVLDVGQGSCDGEGGAGQGGEDGERWEVHCV